MNFKQKLEEAKSLKELYEFREELMKEENSQLQTWQEKPLDRDVNLQNGHNARFFKESVERQIRYLENSGIFLNSIKIKKQ